MTAPRADLAYVAGDPDRVAVLLALARRPGTASEVAERTGASVPVVERTLASFVDRSWVARDRERGEETYRATATGMLVADAVARLLERIAAPVGPEPTDGGPETGAGREV